MNNKLTSRFTIFFAALLLGACAALLPNEYLIDQARLEAKMKNTFPIHQDLGNGMFSATLELPKVNFLENEDKIELVGRFSASTIYIKSLAGNYTLNAGLRYDAQQKALFLRDPHLTLLKIDGDSNYTELVKPAFDVLFAQYAKDNALYRFKPDELRVLGSEIDITAIHIVSKGIKLKLAPKQTTH